MTVIDDARRQAELITNAVGMLITLQQATLNRLGQIVESVHSTIAIPEDEPVDQNDDDSVDSLPSTIYYNPTPYFEASQMEEAGDDDSLPSTILYIPHDPEEEDIYHPPPPPPISYSPTPYEGVGGYLPIDDVDDNFRSNEVVWDWLVNNPFQDQSMEEDEWEE